MDDHVLDVERQLGHRLDPVLHQAPARRVGRVNSLDRLVYIDDS